MIIRRNAIVEAKDGTTGRVRHLVVAPVTKQATALVVEIDGKEWFVPIDHVLEAEGDHVRLPGDRTQLTRRQHHAEHQRERIRSTVPNAEQTTTLRHPRATRAQNAAMSQADEQPYRLQLSEERLRVNKRPERMGSVTLGKRITTHAQTITVPVREERIIIEHRPGDGRILTDAGELTEGTVLDLPVMRERIEVTKEPVVVEEIVVRKQAIQHTEQIQESVRKEELAMGDREGTPPHSSARA